MVAEVVTKNIGCENMDDMELFKLRQKWYSSEEVLYEIVKNLVGRETVFLEGKIEIPLFTKTGSHVRLIKAHKVEFLKKNFDAYDFYNRPNNIYNSVTYFENLPMASFSPTQRKIDQDNFFNGAGFDLCAKKYDLFMDLDSEPLQAKGKMEDEVEAKDVLLKIREYFAIDEMYANAKRLKKVLDDFGLQYSCKFSGLKGMHFLIKDENIFSKEMKFKDKVELAKTIATNIKIVEDIPCMDISIYDQTRLLKTAYSCEGYLVALPLSNEQFDNWKIEDMQLDVVMKNIPIRNRGLLERPKTKDPAEFVKLYGEERLKA